MLIAGDYDRSCGRLQSFLLPLAINHLHNHLSLPGSYIVDKLTLSGSDSQVTSGYRESSRRRYVPSSPDSAHQHSAPLLGNSLNRYRCPSLSLAMNIICNFPFCPYHAPLLKPLRPPAVQLYINIVTEPLIMQFESIQLKINRSD